MRKTKMNFEDLPTMPNCQLTLRLVGGLALMESDELEKYLEYRREMTRLGLEPVCLPEIDAPKRRRMSARLSW